MQRQAVSVKSRKSRSQSTYSFKNSVNFNSVNFNSLNLITFSYDKLKSYYAKTSYNDGRMIITFFFLLIINLKHPHYLKKNLSKMKNKKEQ